MILLGVPFFRPDPGRFPAALAGLCYLLAFSFLVAGWFSVTDVTQLGSSGMPTSPTGRVAARCQRGCVPVVRFIGRLRGGRARSISASPFKLQAPRRSTPRLLAGLRTGFRVLGVEPSKPKSLRRLALLAGQRANGKEARAMPHGGSPRRPPGEPGFLTPALSV